MDVILTLCAASANKKTTGKRWKHAILLSVLALSALLLRPVDALTIHLAPSPAANGASEHDMLLFAASAPLGQKFTTEYIHSVQLTPVQDTYRIVNGRIWSWQERVLSHNAGLPFAEPHFGRFRSNPPWMVFEGGRQSWESFLLRVGDARLGQNVFSYGEDGKRIALYRHFPGERLRLGIKRRPLITLLSERRFPDLQ